MKLPLSPPLLLTCSPRKGGNCDTAAAIFSNKFSQIHTTFLREKSITPCVACGNCARAVKNSAMLLPGEEPTSNKKLFFGCPLTKHDDSIATISSLYTAQSLCIVAPIYFYYFPAMVKSLLDRLQPFWELANSEGVRGGELPPSMPKRYCRCILIAARPTGEKLFEGSLLSLKYVISSLGYTLEEPLLLRGYDKPGELAADSSAVEAIAHYAATAAMEQV